MKNHLLLILFLFTGSAFCQKKLLEEHIHFANNMKLLYPDNESGVAALSKTTKYLYYVDQEQGGLRVRSEEVEEYVATGFNVPHFLYSSFNEKINLASYSIKNNKGTNFKHDKFCGPQKVDGIFYSDAQFCTFKLQFTRPGEYARFQSVLEFSDPRYLTSFYFHDNIPTQLTQVEFKIPDGVEVEFMEMNFEGYEIEKKEEKSEGFTRVVYIMRDIKYLDQVEHLPGSSHYLPHILVLTKSYMANNTRFDVLSSTESLYKWYKSLSDRRTTNEQILRPVVDRVVAGLEDDEEKIKAIFYWVQDNIKYIAFEDGIAAFKPEDSDEVLAQKYGDCKGMANLTADMLKIAGYDAHLSWIGTDRIAYDHDIPSLAVDNHMICSVLLNGEFIHLDATEKHNAIGEYAERIQGKQVLIADGDQYYLETIPKEPLEKNLEHTTVLYNLEDQNLMASGSYKVEGESKRWLIRINEAVPAEKKEVYLKKLVSQDLESTNISIRNEPAFDRDRPLEIEYKVELNDKLSKFGDDLYIDLDFQKELTDRKIKKERKQPYKFESKLYKRMTGTLHVPTGFGVSHLPDALNEKNEYYEFSLSYQLDGNKIRYEKEIKLFKSLLPVDKFGEWNTSIDKLKNFYSDQIILTQK